MYLYVATLSLTVSPSMISATSMLSISTTTLNISTTMIITSTTINAVKSYSDIVSCPPSSTVCTLSGGTTNAGNDIVYYSYMGIYF